MATKVPERKVNGQAGIANTSRPAPKRPPINPNQKPTIVDMKDFRNRLRASNEEALRRAREY